MKIEETLLEEYLRTRPVAHLGTVDPAGCPHIVPICFVFHHGSVYSALDMKPKRVPLNRLRRVTNILQNPNVQVLVDEYDSDWSRLRYIQLRGFAEVLSEEEELEAAMRLLATKYVQYRLMTARPAPALKIEVHSVVIWGRPLNDEDDMRVLPS